MVPLPAITSRLPLPPSSRVDELKLGLIVLTPRASQFSRYLLSNVGSFKKDKNVRADEV